MGARKQTTLVGYFWIPQHNTEGKIIGIKTFYWVQAVKDYLESIDGLTDKVVHWMVNENESTKMPAAEFVKFEKIEHFTFQVGII